MTDNIEQVQNRFSAMCIGQGMGVILLAVVGFLPSPLGLPAAVPGLRMIQVAMGVTLVAGVIGYSVVIMLRRYKSRFDHGSLNYALGIFVVADLLSLLFLVCQEGGLSRSMFVPVFILVPVGFMVVEEPLRTKGIWIVFLSTAVCIGIALWVSLVIAPPIPATLGGALPPPARLNLIIVSIPVTDFQTLSPDGYNVSLFIVSMVSLAIPAMQRLRILKRQTVEDNRG